ncbi:MAG: hypothetical protein MJB14_21285 [Spirochaetes bacterium]|nr:hypothetical protein [Spirochaetota bacterium]
MSDSFSEFKELFEYINQVFQAGKFPKFRTVLQSAASNIKNLRDVLVRKSLVKAENYNYDDELERSFYLPDQKFFTEMEAPRILYSRLNALITACDFQGDQVPETVYEIEDEYLENCRRMLDYFCFHTYSSSNAGINTRMLKLKTDALLNGNDEVLKKVTQDNLKLLTDTFHNIQNTVEEYTKVLKEYYKGRFRFEVFPNLPDKFTEKLFNEDSQEYLAKLDKFLETHESGIPYNKYWIAESVRECYTVEDLNLLERLKNQFLSEKQQQKVESKAKSPRERLISLIYKMVNTKDILETLYINLDFNLKILKSHPKGFFDQLKYVLMKMFNITSELEFFHVEYVHPQTKKIQKDTIKIVNFQTALKKKLAIFAEIRKPQSELHGKVNRGTQQSLMKFMDETYYNLLLTLERISGIDSEIRMNIPRTQKNRLRELSQEIELINNILVQVGNERKKFIFDAEHFAGGKK